MGPIDGYSLDPDNGYATFHSGGQPVVTLPASHQAAQDKMAALGNGALMPPQAVGSGQAQGAPAMPAPTGAAPLTMGQKLGGGVAGALSDMGAGLMRAGGANVTAPTGPLARMHQEKQEEERRKKAQQGGQPPPGAPPPPPGGATPGGLQYGGGSPFGAPPGGAPPGQDMSIPGASGSETPFNPYGAGSPAANLTEMGLNVPNQPTFDAGADILKNR